MEERLKALEDRVSKLEARKRSSKQLTEEEWFKELKANPLYQGIDIDREYAKMTEWCRARTFQPTRRRFINWLNKADKPLNGGNGNGGFNPAREELVLSLKNQANKYMPQLSNGAKQLFYEQKKHWIALQAEVQAGIITF
jgi:hypothetical protein